MTTKATHQRSITADGGPYLRMTNAERLQDLRRRVASSENKETLRRVAGEVEELRWVVVGSLRDEAGALLTRLKDKIERLGPSGRKRRHVQAVVDHSGEVAPTTRMRSTAWEVDELGNLSRVVFNALDGAVPPALPPVVW